MQQVTKFLSTLFRPLRSAKIVDRAAPGRRRAASIWMRIVSAAFCAAVWLYLALLLAVWVLIYFAGDRWWAATVVLFGPRWVWGLPLAVLVPVAAIWRRRSLLVLAPTAAIVVVPIMGLCLGLSRSAATGPHLRVLTCNVDGKNLRAEALRALVLQTRPERHLPARVRGRRAMAAARAARGVPCRMCRRIRSRIALSAL